VIGGRQLGSEYEFSPNLLTEGERSRSAPQFQFRKYDSAGRLEQP
jgi:hypothetical protein